MTPKKKSQVYDLVESVTPGQSSFWGETKNTNTDVPSLTP